MKNLNKSTQKAVSWNLLKIIFGNARTFIVSIILARLLEPEDFGLIGMAMVFAYFCDTIFDLGFGSAIIQRKSVTQEQKSTVFYINMLLGVFFGLAMYFSAGLIAGFFDMPLLEDISKVMSVTFLIKGVTSLQRSLFAKELNFKTPFVSEMIGGIISAIFGIVLALNGYGVWSLVYSQVLNWVLNSLVLWIMSSWRPSFEFNLNSVSDLWKFGYKQSLTVFIETFFNRLDTIIIGKIFDAAALGLFYKAKSLVRITIQYAFGAFSGVLFPSFSLINEDIERQKRLFRTILSFTCFSTFLLSGLLVINAKEIIVILYTEKWIGSVIILKIFGFFTYAITISSVLTPAVLSRGESGALLKVEVYKKVMALIPIPIAYFYGLNYFLIAGFILGNIGLIFNMNLMHKYFNIKISEQLAVIGKHFFPFLLLITVFYFLDQVLEFNNIVAVILKSSIYIIVFVGINMLLKSIGLQYIIGFIKSKLNKKING
ncbi:lipopolysaccharide biosynthesis protein [Winogradskyella arenosi]|uniref:O-antigen/teichoic acid export membrane protein n=1 Tax=Winogradskyella arenosi TaxID=533325 RepID=A0A368ZH32_9FLAO|nr:lipopolysaccharide biosynthesis protein [Winogradskyella arenosi]RCW90262.1 O-antigen/teichoic acid export membrane protein [Winogradskyella arenosi]